MRFIFSFTSIILLLLLVGVSHIPAEEVEPKITIGVYENPPLLYTGEENRGAGLFADLIEHLAEREGWSLEYLSGNWQQGLERLESGQIDLLPAMAYSQERAQKYLFNRETVFSNWGQVYTSMDSDISSFLGLEGKRIAVVPDDIHHIGSRGIRNTLEKFSVESIFVEVVSYPGVMEAIEDGRADAGVLNRLNGRLLSEDYRVKASPILFNPIEMRYAISPERENGNHIRDTIDIYIKDMKSSQNSYYDRLLEKYISGGGAKNNIPAWMVYTLLVLGLLLLVATLVVIIFRAQLKKYTRNLRDSRQEYENLFSSIRDTIVIADNRRIITSANQPALKDMFLYETEEVVGKDASILYSDLSLYEKTGEEVFDQHGNSLGKIMEVSFARKDGSVFPAELFALKLYDEKNRVVGNFGIIRDITERRKAQDKLKNQLREKETLIKEIHHRVKNNLNVVISLLNLYEEKIVSVEEAHEAFEESRQRIYSMALVHESLYHSDDLSMIQFDEYIQTMVGQIQYSSTYSYNIKYRLDLERVSIDITKAVPCGIIINELITNAHKHAFSYDSDGEIVIELRKTGNNLIDLSVKDNGIPFPEDYSRHFTHQKGSSLGFHLIDILAEQIDGEFILNTERGKRFSVIFPI